MGPQSLNSSHTVRVPIGPPERPAMTSTRLQTAAYSCEDTHLQFQTVMAVFRAFADAMLVLGSVHRASEASRSVRGSGGRAPERRSEETRIQETRKVNQGACRRRQGQMREAHGRFTRRWHSASCTVVNLLLQVAWDVTPYDSAVCPPSCTRESFFVCRAHNRRRCC